METPMHEEFNATNKQPKRTLEETDEVAASSTKSNIMEGKNNASLHGISYQLRLGLVILLRLYKMHKTDVQFDFELTFEDPKAGKFDDVLVRYNSWKDKQAGIACIQTKHRQHTYIGDQQKSKTYETISEADLLSIKRKGQFSIRMYFESFLDIHKPESKETQKYIICTNKTLDKRASCLTLANLQGSCIPSFMQDINATFYQFDCAKKVKSLDEILKGVVISKGYTEKDSLSIIQEFYDNFILACGSVNETMLYNIVMKSLMQLVDFQHISTYEKFHVCMFEAINRGPKSLKPSDVDEMFKLSESGRIIEYFRINTIKHVESLRHKYFDVKLNSPVLQETNLFKFLQNKSPGIYWYNSTCDTDVSIHILEQIVNHAGYEMVLLDYSSYKDVLNHSIATVFTCSSRCESEIENLQRILITITTQGKTLNFDQITKLTTEYCMKFIIVEQVTKDENTVLDKTVESFCVGDLSEDSRNHLYEKNVIQFGTSVALRNIIELDDDLSNLYIFLGIKEEDRKSLHEIRYKEIEQLYVGRHFICLYKKDMKFEDRAIKYINFDDDCNIPGLVDGNNCSKVNIILNDAGLGKSTCFIKLAWRLSTIIESSYVIRLNAFIYSTDFNRLRMIDVEHLDNDAVLRILYCFNYLFVRDNSKHVDFNIEKRRQAAQVCAKLLSYSDGKVVVDETEAKKLNFTTNQVYELRLFKEKINANLVILLLDGFDEIAPDYKQVVLKCFSKFAKLEGIRHIYLSSRPYHFISEFEQSFPDCRMYQLRPFSEDDRKSALGKYIREAKDYAKKDEQWFNALMQDLENLPEQLLSVPLFLHMAFEIRFPVVKNIASLHSGKKIKETQSFNTFQLIEAFVDKKVQRRYLEKRGIPLSYLDKPGETKKFGKCLVETKQQHALLAMFAFFNEEDRTKILNNDDERKAFQCMEKTKVALDKTGIIVGVQDGTPRFILRILAEYFVAFWLFRNKDRIATVNFFRSKSFWTEEMQIIRDFLDRMILGDSDGCKMHQAIIDDALWTCNFLQEDHVFAQVKDAFGRLPLHIAVARCLEPSQVVQLLEIMPNEAINARDELCHWSALDYAFLRGSENNVKLLLHRGAEVNLDILLQQICANNLKDLLVDTHNYAEWLKSNGNTKTLADLLNSRIVKYLDKERQFDIDLQYDELDGLNFLRFCVKNDMVGIFKLCILPMVDQTRSPRVGIFQRVCEQAVLGTQHPLSSIVKLVFKKAYNQIRREVMNEFQVFDLVLKHKSFEIIIYLIVECKLISFPDTRCDAFFVRALELCIEENRMNNVEVIFEKLCRKLNIKLLNDTDIDKNILLLDHNISQQLTNIPYICLWNCCVTRAKNVQLTLPELGDRNVRRDGFVVEALLAKAIHHGNIWLLNYIIEKTGTKITNRLIVMIMRLVSKYENISHENSIPFFDYLLNRSSDLYSVDGEGRNLLHMTAQNGCLFMLHCLIAKGFDATLINARNGWNVLHYALYNDGVEGRIFNTLNYLNEHLGTNKFDLLDSMLNCEYLAENEVVSDAAFISEGSQNSNKLSKKQHSILGLLSISNEECKNKLLTEQECKEVTALMKQIEQNEKTSIIIKKKYNGIPRFVHGVFGRYFAACWLYENTDRMKREDFFRTSLFWCNYASICVTDLFNRFVLKESSGCEVHLAVLNQSENQVSKLLLKAPSLALEKDVLGRLPLHLAVMDHYSFENLHKLLECMPSDAINTRDDLLQWSALDYAFVTGNKVFVKMLLARGASVDIDTLLQQICSNNTRDLVATAHNYAEWLQSYEYTKPTADQIHTRVMEYLINERQGDNHAHHEYLDWLTDFTFWEGL